MDKFVPEKFLALEHDPESSEGYGILIEWDGFPKEFNSVDVVGPRSRTTAALVSQRLAGWNEHLSKLLRTFHEQSERHDWSVTATSHFTFTIGWPMREPGVACQEQDVIFQR